MTLFVKINNSKFFKDILSIAEKSFVQRLIND